MAGIYKAIERRLCKKNVLRMGTQPDKRLVTASDIETSDAEFFIEDMIYFLGGLAFTGLRNAVIDFTLEHWSTISKRFRKSKELLLDKVLPQPSFLRSLNPSSKNWGPRVPLYAPDLLLLLL